MQPMTKQEVLQGALALNGEGKKYRISVKGDRIITEAKVQTGHSSMTFRSIACLNDDNTYVEIHKSRDSDGIQLGKVVTKQWSGTLSFDKESRRLQAQTEAVFDSEDCKKVVRDYLERCGYRRTNKGFWKRLFGK